MNAFDIFYANQNPANAVALAYADHAAKRPNCSNDFLDQLIKAEAHAQVHPDLVRILGKILRAHDSNNNGAYMGEAKLCQAFAHEARDVLIAAGAESELMPSMLKAG